MKTRDLILDIALFLFNERGEGMISSVDLANEMNISPGNLYYHFKGKQEVVQELYAQFHSKLSLVLDDLEQSADASGKMQFAYLCVIAEVFTEYRFITRDVFGFNQKYPELQKQLVRLIKKLHRILVVRSMQMYSSKLPRGVDQAPRVLANNIINTLLNYDICDQLLLGEQDNNSKNSLEAHLYMQLLPFIEN